MLFRSITKGSLVLSLVLFVFAGSVFLIPARATGTQESSTAASQQPTPSPKPTPRDEEILPTEDIIRTETNLTNIFFSAEDKYKRYISTLKQDDIRVLEDGEPQQIFTFQQNTDLPLSLAILIDTSRSDRKSTRLNSSHRSLSRMPSSA